MKRPTDLLRPRRTGSNLPHYQTFPTPPPRTRGQPPTSPDSQDGGHSRSPYHCDASQTGHQTCHHGSPLPKRQLAVLAFISLAEQTALNSISPYLPEMTSSFPGTRASQTGLYVGIIASSFALAQLATNYFWGWASDRIGRKPVVMLGTLCTAVCFAAFGFCRTLWQAIAVQLLMGMLNGNQGVVSTCLGEITDRSNQSKAFVWLPVIYGIGGIAGPAVGGLMVDENSRWPYLLPNLFSAAILLLDLLLTGLFLDESLEEAKDLPPLRTRVGVIFSWLWQFTGGARRPTYTRGGHARHHGDDDTASTHSSVSEQSSLLDPISALTAHNDAHLTSSVLNRDTILLLATYLIFQLSNVSFNSLFPIFASAPVPTGRALSPEEIGLSLSFAGLVTIFFQIGAFARLKAKMGNKATYRAGLLLFGVSMWLMPWVGYRSSPPLFGRGSGKLWLWIELGSVLLIKTVAAVGGLTSALLLITNTAPNHSVLGTMNGLAQTLSAAGRAVGPFVSGGLFSLSTRIEHHGEVLAWGVFGGVAFAGWVLSWGIKGEELESGSWAGDDVGDAHTDDEADESDADEGQHSGHSQRSAAGTSR